MNVKSLTVGPIVGATTATSVRLWGRGSLKVTRSGVKRCIGVVRLGPDASQFGVPRFFLLNPNFDMTGVVVYENLMAKTSYVYQMGCFFSKRDFDNLDNLELDWDDVAVHEFTTASAVDTEPRTLVFGSCRYILRLFGGSWFDDRGDKTFRSILEQIEAGSHIDQFLMLGDQIYADDLNVLRADETLDQYLERYQIAFSQPHISQLMSRVPTYMTLDDHEIENDWPADSSPRDLTIKYPAAIHAFQIYQRSHSPAFAVVDGHISGVLTHYWYTYHDGCCDFFVSDTRTERTLPDEEGNQIMSDTQLDAMLAWLADGSGRVKVLVTAVPLFPESRVSNNDKWGGFPDQRSRLLDFIREQQIKPVVCLSGDVHSSFSAELRCVDDPAFQIITAISSAFFWPYPHNSRFKFKINGQIPSTLSDAVYQVENASKVHPTDNFTRLTIDPTGVLTEIFDRKGRLLEERQLAFV